MVIVQGVIAELSNSANGSLDRAHRIIEACAKAGVSWMKFQAYTVAELCTLRGVPADQPALAPWDHMTMGELYTKAQTPHGWFPSLIRKCNEVGLPWFSSVFGPDSLHMLESLNCPVYKLASLDRDADGFRRAVRMTGKPIIQSSPEHMTLKNVTQLYCPPGYPQPMNLPAIAEAMTWADGFSYHGTDVSVPIFAREVGAKIIEVHVQLDDEPSELEADCCLTMTQLAELAGRKLVDLGTIHARRKRSKGRSKATARLEVL